MSQAAVPKYIQEKLNLDKLAPGHKFNLFFPYWDDKWDATENQKASAIRTTLPIPEPVKKIQNAIVQRQKCLAQIEPDKTLRIPAISESPFATGLGLEHPVKNGFAFLAPYGLPYLAGSGVKGVLRRAAEEMALFGKEYPGSADDFCMLDVWWLFGFEGSSCSIRKKGSESKWRQAFQKQLELIKNRKEFLEFIERQPLTKEEKKRFKANTGEYPAELFKDSTFLNSTQSQGALTFWDVFPKCEKMAIEIMTPHYSEYYQNGHAPHDSGQPTPIPFLVVPPETECQFIFRCNPRRLPERLAATWKATTRKIFEFAVKWFGFGAKTAVGYGAFHIDIKTEEREEKEAEIKRKEAETEQKKALEEARLASMTPEEKRLEEFGKVFENRKEKGEFKIQGAFHEERLKFFKEALTWKDFEHRKAASEILERTIEWSLWTNKKKEFKQWLSELKGAKPEAK